MAKDRPTLLAVDGTALAFRAFFAIRGLTDELGRPSGALYGYLASLLRDSRRGKMRSGDRWHMDHGAVMVL